MVRIGIFGASGKMGSSLQLISPSYHIESIPLSLCKNNPSVDGIIDVSSNQITLDILDYACKHSLPLVIGTTGLDQNHFAAIEKAGQSIPIFQAANFSVGIALLKKSLRSIQNDLKKSCIHILEEHLETKKDIPSGTAKELSAIFGKAKIVSIRSQKPIFKHQVEISFCDESLIFSHEGYDRKIFAKGAIQAFLFLKKQNPGLYNMDDLIH